MNSFISTPHGLCIVYVIIRAWTCISSQQNKKKNKNTIYLKRIYILSHVLYKQMKYVYVKKIYSFFHFKNFTSVALWMVPIQKVMYWYTLRYIRLERKQKSTSTILKRIWIKKNQLCQAIWACCFLSFFYHYYLDY